MRYRFVLASSTETAGSGGALIIQLDWQQQTSTVASAADGESSKDILCAPTGCARVNKRDSARNIKLIVDIVFREGREWIAEPFGMLQPLESLEAPQSGRLHRRCSFEENIKR